jgi:hypothetical protein
MIESVVNYTYKKGQPIVLTGGDYSDYSIWAIMIAAKEFKLADVIAKMLYEDKSQFRMIGSRPKVRLASLASHLLSRGYVTEADDWAEIHEDDFCLDLFAYRV